MCFSLISVKFGLKGADSVDILKIDRSQTTNNYNIEQANIYAPTIIADKQGLKNIRDCNKMINGNLKEYGIQKIVNEKLEDPEMLATTNIATAIAYKISLPEKQRLLASLICGKFMCENADISERSIVFSRAIEAMDSLTLDNLRVLAFITLFVSNHVKDTITSENFEAFYDGYVEPLTKPLNKQQLRRHSSMFKAMGLAYTPNTWGTSLTSYMSSDFVKVEGKYKNNLSDEAQEKVKRTEQVWIDITGDYLSLSPVGECIGRLFLISYMQYEIKDNLPK